MNETNKGAEEVVHVLLVEDNPADSLLIRSMLLESTQESFSFSSAESLAQCFDLVADNTYDIVLLDLTLPDTHGLETFSAVYAKIPDTPIIVLSGLDDETMSIRAVNLGAQDYLVKGQVDQFLLLRAVRYSIERKSVEQKLRQSEAFYQSLVENLPQNIIRKDVNGQFTFANQRFCSELGMSIDDVIGRTDFDFFPPTIAAKYQEDDREVMTTGRIYDAVEEHPTPDGPTNYVQVVKTPIYDDTAQIIGIQIIFWDVTEKTLAAEKIRKANNDLAKSREDLLKALADLQRSHNELKDTQLQLIEMEKMQTIGQLAAGVAHEVKTPLAILRMGVEFLNNSVTLKDEKNAVILTDMADAIHRADTIIMGMLDFSAHRQLDMNNLDLNELVTDSFRLVQHQFKGADYEIEQRLGDNLPSGLGDANKLKQVFVNLFTNAAHAMPDGGTLTITTKLGNSNRFDEENLPQEGKRDTVFHEAGERNLMVEIADTGTGIPEDKLKRIFDPFFTTKAAGHGTGLGLSVTRKIIELHHGRLEVENRPIKGALVRVTLLSQRPAI
jgi:PAS domain S-box-containing protein